MEETCFGFINRGFSSIKINFGYDLNLYKDEIGNFFNDCISSSISDICFDFMNVDYLKNDILYIIIEFCKKHQNLRIRFSAINLKYDVMNVFKMNDLTQYFHNLTTITY